MPGTGRPVATEGRSFAEVVGRDIAALVAGYSAHHRSARTAVFSLDENAISDYCQSRVDTAEGARARDLYLARRESAADRKPVRRVRRHHVSRPAALPQVQRRRHVRGEAAAPRHPGGVDHAGLSAGRAVQGPTGKDFVPFGVGLVQLDDVIRVEGRLTENDPEKLQFGMDVELTMVPFTTDEEGNELVTFAFQPV